MTSRLLEAEKQGADIVADAKKARTARLREAQREAEKDVAAQRAKKEVRLNPRQFSFTNRPLISLQAEIRALEDKGVSANAGEESRVRQQAATEIQQLKGTARQRQGVVVDLMFQLVTGL